MWEVPAFLHPEHINSIEMVFVDEKKKLVEGLVYKVSYFSVAPNSSSYRTTPYAYKLFFQMKIKVNVCEGPFLPLYGLNLTKIDEIVRQTVDGDFLIGSILEMAKLPR